MSETFATLADRMAEMRAEAAFQRAKRLASGPTSCAHCGEEMAQDEAYRLHREYRVCKGLPGHEWKTTATGNCYWAGRCDECGQTRQQDSSG